VIVLQRLAGPMAWADLARFESREDARAYLRTVKNIQLPATGYRLVRRQVVDEVVQ
jgi:hypothetical protein